MRWTVAGDSPTCLASRRALQWVAALGLRRVALITACSLVELISRGRPERALVRRPARPCLRERLRQTAIVLGETLNRRAIGRTPSPPALASITLACRARLYGRVRPSRGR